MNIRGDGFEGRTYDTDNDWVECPKCRYVMLELADFELQRMSEYPAIEADGLTFILWGWAVFVGQIVYQYVVGLATFGARKAKLAQAKADVLPRFPGSLVCPKCLTVVKRG